MRNWNFLKIRVSEIRVNQIRVNQIRVNQELGVECILFNLKKKNIHYIPRRVTRDLMVYGKIIEMLYSMYNFDIDIVTFLCRYLHTLINIDIQASTFKHQFEH